MRIQRKDPAPWLVITPKDGLTTQAAKLALISLNSAISAQMLQKISMVTVQARQTISTNSATSFSGQLEVEIPDTATTQTEVNAKALSATIGRQM